MANVVIVGMQWGDEGKGRIIDLLASESDVVVRYQGGANAGHTVIVGTEKYVLHLLPSGVLHPGVVNVVGNGVVVDPWTLLDEVHDLERRGLSLDGRLLVSDRAHVVLPYHKYMDRALEGRPDGVPTVLLAHDPDRFPQAVKKGVSLVLAGHTHGGQIAVPFLARHINASKLAHKFHIGI